MAKLKFPTCPGYQIVRRLQRSALHSIYRKSMQWSGTLNRQLVVFDIDAVGLREHYNPIINWLIKYECTVVIAVVDMEFSAYRAGGVPRGAWCMSKSEFAKLNCIPAVTVSFQPQNGSELAQQLRNAKTQRVVMQHGLSDKDVFTDDAKPDPLADFDAVFLAGQIFREGSLERYRQKYPDTFNRLRFMEIGLPKTDALFNTDLKRAALLLQMGLDPALKTVCYAPTWENCASLEKNGPAIIESLAALPINVIVKLHHLSLSLMNYDWLIRDGHGGKNWRQIICEIEKRRPNVKLAMGQDATPYMLASDVLVSDASGAAYEFMLVNRPVVFFDVPELFARYGKNGIHFWGREGGDIVRDIEELTGKVMLNVRHPERKKPQREKLLSRICYSRGDATEKAGRAILALMEAPRTHG
jgi:hypothetical protein